MRKITEIMSKSFRDWEEKSMSNTIVKYNTNTWMTKMFLHWNEIAILDCLWVLKLDNCGWETNTTKERLNWILDIFDLWHIFQKNYKWYYMDKNWKVFSMDSWTIILSIKNKNILSIYNNFIY